MKSTSISRPALPMFLRLGMFYRRLSFHPRGGLPEGLVARNALVPLGRKKAQYRVVPWVTFTDPEVARVGLTEEEARQQHGKVMVRRFPWSDIY